MNMPIVTLSLRGMQQEISHAFAQHCEEIQEQVEAVMAELLKPENIRNIAREEIARDMRSMLQRSFESAVHHAVYEAMRSDEVKLALAKRVKDAFLSNLNE